MIIQGLICWLGNGCPSLFQGEDGWHTSGRVSVTRCSKLMGATAPTVMAVIITCDAWKAHSLPVFSQCSAVQLEHLDLLSSLTSKTSRVSLKCSILSTVKCKRYLLIILSIFLFLDKVPGVCTLWWISSLV